MGPQVTDVNFPDISRYQCTTEDGGYHLKKLCLERWIWPITNLCGSGNGGRRQCTASLPVCSTQDIFTSRRPVKRWQRIGGWRAQQDCWQCICRYALRARGMMTSTGLKTRTGPGDGEPLYLWPRFMRARAAGATTSLPHTQRSCEVCSCRAGLLHSLLPGSGGLVSKVCGWNNDFSYRRWLTNLE